MSMTKEEAFKQYEEWRNLGFGHSTMPSSEVLVMAMDALRPIGREQVILCRDCRFWQDNNGGYPHPEGRWGNDETPDADDYCSFAERK